MKAYREVRITAPLILNLSTRRRCQRQALAILHTGNKQNIHLSGDLLDPTTSLDVVLKRKRLALDRIRTPDSLAPSRGYPVSLKK